MTIGKDFVIVWDKYKFCSFFIIFFSHYFTIIDDEVCLEIGGGGY